LKTIKVEKRHGLATITLNRPPLNLIGRQMIEGLRQAAEDLAGDENISVVIITGAGNRAFSAGVDIKEMKDLDMTTAKDFISRLHYSIKAIRDLEKVVIAAINGYCFGGSCELAMACDIRIAGENAQLGMPEIKVGIPSVIEAALMPLLIGNGRAREFLFLGESITAEEAQNLGLVNRVVPADKLSGEVRKIADRILSYSPTAIKMQKRIVNRWLPSDLESAINYSIQAFSECFATNEAKEAMTAFLEKRQPRFKKKR